MPLRGQTIRDIIVPMACEIDRGMLGIYERSFDLSPGPALELASHIPILKNHEIDVEIRKSEYHSPCWTLVIDKYPATMAQCRKTAFAIAERIGVFPAPMYEEIEEYYDPEFETKYKKEFVARCIYRHPYCIRPSHLQLTDNNFRPLTTYLTPAELDILLKHRAEGTN